MKKKFKQLFAVLTHRAIIVGFLLVFQVVALVLVIEQFSDYFFYFYVLCVLISLSVVLFIVNKTVDPGYKIAWIVPILLLPLFGGLLYLYLGGGGPSRKIREKVSVMQQGMSKVLDTEKQAAALTDFGQDAVNQCRYLEERAHCPVCSATGITYYALGDHLFEPLIKALREAKRYIFLEFFIIAPGVFWDSILAVLEAKVLEGVEVRVIYDDVGSLLTLPMDYAKTLSEKGILCRVFNRLRPIPSIRLNNRDHRKICVIDGHTAFTGGFNLADEYINGITKYGHWKDSGVLLRGEGAWPLTVMFLTMWEFVGGEQAEFDRWRPNSQFNGNREQSGWVQPYTDAPLDLEPVSETVYRNLISKAKRYIYLTTPYLIPNTSLHDALCSAAKSGVDVRIITPHIPDKKAVLEATRAHYLSLLEAGVRIYEYTPGFMHAKNCVCDDLYATIGSVNLDYRSLFLNFENGVWICDAPTAQAVKADFLDTVAVSHEVTLYEARAHRFPRMLFRSILRVFAPLL